PPGDGRPWRGRRSPVCLATRPVRSARRTCPRGQRIGCGGHRTLRCRTRLRDRRVRGDCVASGAAAAGPRALVMLPGVDGHLLSSAYIEQMLAAIGEPADVAVVRRTLTAWRTACAGLGPASTPRAMLQSATALFAALGFEPPERLEPADPAIAATLRARNGSVALLVSPWGESRDPIWRLAVTHAGQRSASWCLIFNGLHLRIVDASRLYARRHLEIDLDLAIDHPRTFAVLLGMFGAAALAAAPDDPRSLHALVAGSQRHAAG